jgi:hypothetical protein
VLCIYPISIAIVEVEDTVTWKWFLSTLKDDLGIENTRPWTFMSDRKKVCVFLLFCVYLSFVCAFINCWCCAFILTTIVVHL